MGEKWDVPPIRMEVLDCHNLIRTGSFLTLTDFKFYFLAII